MTDESPKDDQKSDEESSSSLSDEGRDERREARFESRLANIEAQIYALQDGLAEVQTTRRAAKQRALMIRLGLLVILTGALFYVMFTRSAGG